MSEKKEKKITYDINVIDPGRSFLIEPSEGGYVLRTWEEISVGDGIAYRPRSMVFTGERENLELEEDDEETRNFYKNSYEGKMAKAFTELCVELNDNIGIQHSKFKKNNFKILWNEKGKDCSEKLD